MAWYKTGGKDIFWHNLPNVSSSFTLSAGNSKTIAVTKMPKYIMYTRVAYNGSISTTRCGVLYVGDDQMYNLGYISSGKVNEQVDVDTTFTSITSSSVVVKLNAGAYSTTFTVSIWY